MKGPSAEEEGPPVRHEAPLDAGQVCNEAQSGRAQEQANVPSRPAALSEGAVGNTVQSTCRRSKGPKPGAMPCNAHGRHQLGGIQSRQNTPVNPKSGAP